MSLWLGSKSLALISPTERLGHRSIEVLDKGQYFGLEISNRGKDATLEQLTGKNAEPQLNLVHSGSVLGGVVKDDAMSRVREKSCPAGHRGQDARFALDPRVDIQVGLLGHISDEGFGLMSVEIVHDEMPFHDMRIGLDGALDIIPIQ